MQKGFGNSSKKKNLKDSRYLRFYNLERYANELLKNKNAEKAKKIYIQLLENGYQNYGIFFNLGFIEISQKNHKEAIKYLSKAKSLLKKNDLKLNLLI